MNWFDELQKKKKEKGMRKLSKFLEENGFSIVEQGEGGKHLTIKVRRLEEKDDVDAQTVVTTVSHKTSGDSGKGRLKMVLKEIQNLFKGRKRRGQGEFKLSENYKEKTWTDILKDGITNYQFIQLLVDADLPVQMARKLNKKLKDMYPTEGQAGISRRLSDNKTINYFNDRVRRMSVQKRARISSKIARVYETTDDTSLKPGPRGAPNPRSQTRREQFENITDAELEMLVKYMLHLIETM
tara:strand:+ start:7508 stop:8227 length:720 start_codon:yes stop_codon:yes gene_type:complete